MVAAHTVTPAERLFRARRISTTFGRVYLGAKANQLIERRLRPLDMDRRWSAFHAGSAARIHRLAVDLRGLVLKGCQFIGARADVVPSEYVEVLSRLQDRVPPRSFDVVRAMVERELQCRLEDVFARFSPKPIAAASLAQVHEAHLHGGRRVAVKVQYPEIAEQVKGDLANLRALFRAVGWLERDLDLLPIFDELGAQLPRELDFEAEGRNAEAVAQRLAHRPEIAIPEIVWKHTRRRVLVMEYMDGIKITDREALRAAGVDLSWVTRTLVDVFSEQILGHGFFHADPHPGNLFVQPEGPRLVLLDFGLAKELPETFRRGVVGFVAALVQGDVDAMTDALCDLGFETRSGTREGLREIAEFVLRVAIEIRARGALDPDMAARFGNEIPARVRANPVVRLPHHLVLVGRAVGLLSGLTRELGAHVDLLKVAAPWAFGAAARRGT
ncbi:MAG TPA: ABC1 kinase family protein [Myxococcota bacterium]|nr:ABC1 kinase family protein [Myxococcota bacterium]